MPGQRVLQFLVLERKKRSDLNFPKRQKKTAVLKEYLTTSTKVFRENLFFNMESYAPAIVKNVLYITVVFSLDIV
jgi:hypothetical protein